MTASTATYSIGISAYYHDSAAVLVCNGEIVAAAQEERFSRIKHDAAFPIQAVRYVLDDAKISLADVDCVVFYEKPFIKFERLLETYHAFAPNGFLHFAAAIPIWIKEKLFFKALIRRELLTLGNPVPPFQFCEHHLSHAASAFYPSPFQEAAILTLDGVGEWATTTISKGVRNTITVLKELRFPHSLGLLYSAFTYYCGFKVNSGEYKLMGLAAYGDGESDEAQQFRRSILKHLVDIREDGSFLLNMDYFDFPVGFSMTHDSKWAPLFGPRRLPESGLSQRIKNLAWAIQSVTEAIVLRLAKTAQDLTGAKHLVLAGGVALNCVANQAVLDMGIYEDIWIQPAAGDSGGALGAALSYWYISKRMARVVTGNDSMKMSLLGPQYSSSEIERLLNSVSAQYRVVDTVRAVCAETAAYLAQGLVVGWFQGRSEFGPRALGNRSILADPRNPMMQEKLNATIKYRESFRPFAPMVLEERLCDYFDTMSASPYMLRVATVLEPNRKEVPAITHVDATARLQTVNQGDHPMCWQLLKAFEKETGCPMLVNTSFNARGDAVVCSPAEAYQCFMDTDMDILVLGTIILRKVDQYSHEKTRGVC